MALYANFLSVTNVLFNSAEQPSHALLVIVVLLALDNDLLPAVDELIPTFFRKIVLQQELLSAISMLVGAVFVLRWDAIGDVIAIATYTIAKRLLLLVYLSVWVTSIVICSPTDVVVLPEQELASLLTT